MNGAQKRPSTNSVAFKGDKLIGEFSSHPNDGSPSEAVSGLLHRTSRRPIRRNRFQTHCYNAANPKTQESLSMPWSQIYTPVGNLLLSALVAALPVVVLLGLLAFWHVRAHWAALAGLSAALVCRDVCVRNAGETSAGRGRKRGCVRLVPHRLDRIKRHLCYDITVMTGKFDVVKQTIAGLASDRRIQALLIGFSFGAFIEGAAGFGTPVAICAAMLIGLGFKPLAAAGLSLIGNTAPVAFGALGTPIIALAGVTGLPMQDLSAMVGRQLPVFSVIVPFWLVWAMAGRKGMVEVWPACLVSGLTFAIPQYVVSNFYGPSLVDIASSLVSIGSLVLLLQILATPFDLAIPGRRSRFG